MAFLGISIHLFQKQILPACQECCSCCLCKVCSSLEQKKGYERAITGEQNYLDMSFMLWIIHASSSIGVGGTEPLYDLMEIFNWTPINGATKRSDGAPPATKQSEGASPATERSEGAHPMTERSEGVHPATERSEGAHPATE